MIRPMLGDCSFAVIDVETTGLFPRGHDRIVEIAVIRLGRTGEPEDEFVTLVDPERDVGPTRLHGITARDLLGAPKFREIAGDVTALLAGAVLVAHNARFDADFLDAELGRVTDQCPPLPMLCTMTLAHRIVDTAPSYRLDALCKHLSLPNLVEAHSALGDARATVRVFGALLRRALDSGVNTLRALGCSYEPSPVDAWPLLPKGGSVITRQHAQARSEPSYLARLVSRLQAEPVHRDVETLEYLDLLDRVLEDRVVTERETEGLFETATRWGLTRDRILGIHQSYIEGLVRAAVADGVVTPAERNDLELVVRLFGYDTGALDAMLRAAHSDRAAGVVAQSAPAKESVAGMSVCFTGDSVLTYLGEHLTRAIAEELATRAGLVVKTGVTRDLDLLVVVDAHSLSSKALKAKRYGTRIVAEKVFWEMIGVPVS